MKISALLLFIVTFCSLSSMPASAFETPVPDFDNKKLKNGAYSLNAYGFLDEPYEKIQQRWHVHAKKICGSNQYQSVTKESKKQKYFWVQTGCTQYPKKSNVRAISGELSCSTI